MFPDFFSWIEWLTRVTHTWFPPVEMLSKPIWNTLILVSNLPSIFQISDLADKLETWDTNSMRGGPGSLTSYSGGGTSGGADRGPSSLSDVDKGICLSIGLQGCRGGGLLYTQFEAVVTIIPALITNRPPWSPCRNFLYKGSFDRNCKCGELFRFQPISKPYYSICPLWKCNDSNEL